MSRVEGRQGISLAALAVTATRAVEDAIAAGQDPEDIEPKVRVSFGAKIKQLEIEIP